MAAVTPRLYSEEIGQAILAELAAGRSLRDVCSDSAMPAESTVRLWATQDDAFGARLERARVLGAHAWCDQMLRIADGAHDNDSAAAARVQVDTRKWLLSKLLPRTYGDRVELHHTGDATIAVLLGEARRRAALLEHDLSAVSALPAPQPVEGP